jgi:predicted dienelactone hydrolase
MQGLLKSRWASRLLAALLLLLAPVPAFADASGAELNGQTITLVDPARKIKASMGFAGSDTRRIDVKLWLPRGKGPFPLVIYSHGTFGHSSNAMHLVRALVEAGYVVAAPDYPLTSSQAWTKVHFADISDVIEQTRDVSFIIDSLIADPKLGRRIDSTRIGTTGHSLGAVTSYFTSFGARLRDPRIKATAPIAGGDPVQSAFDAPMGLAGAGYSPIPVPVLFLSAERDVFTALTGPPHVAYTRVASPKHEVLIMGGVHVWFTDSSERPADGKNPDCGFFEKYQPQMKLYLCEARYDLIDPARQQEITRDALVAFFDRYLKGDEAALARLERIGDRFAEAKLMSSP